MAIRSTVLALLLTMAGAARAEAPLRFVLKDHKLSPPTLDVPAGSRFRLEVVNQDDSVDEFESYDLKVEKIVVAGGTVSVMAGPLHPGTYKVFDDYHPDTAHAAVTAK